MTGANRTFVAGKQAPIQKRRCNDIIKPSAEEMGRMAPKGKEGKWDGYQVEELPPPPPGLGEGWMPAENWLNAQIPDKTV